MNEHLPKHPLGVARRIAGLRQQELAEKIGYSLQMIKKVEGGGNKISKSMAYLAQLKLGTDCDWLLEGDPTKPAIGSDKNPYTKETYERALASELFEQTYPFEKQAGVAVLLLVKMLASEFAAYKHGDRRLVVARLADAVGEIRRQFPECKDQEMKWQEMAMAVRSRGVLQTAAEAASKVLNDFEVQMEVERQRKLKALEKSGMPGAGSKSSKRRLRRVK